MQEPLEGGTETKVRSTAVW